MKRALAVYLQIAAAGLQAMSAQLDAAADGGGPMSPSQRLRRVTALTNAICQLALLAGGVDAARELLTRVLQAFPPPAVDAEPEQTRPMQRPTFTAEHVAPPKGDRGSDN